MNLQGMRARLFVVNEAHAITLQRPFVAAVRLIAVTAV
jgi:hypothetical protein